MKTSINHIYTVTYSIPGFGLLYAEVGIRSRDKKEVEKLFRSSHPGNEYEILKIEHKRLDIRRPAIKVTRYTGRP